MALLVYSFISSNAKTFGFKIPPFITSPAKIRPRQSPVIIQPEVPNHKINQFCIDEDVDKSEDGNKPVNRLTLRQFLSNPDGFHLALAPAFFGFYVYFGILTVFNEHILSEDEVAKGMVVLPAHDDNVKNFNENVLSEDEMAKGMAVLPVHNNNGRALSQTQPLLQSVAGASAGAIAAVLLARGVNPRDSADFASTMTLDKFADPPGFGGILKGEIFEEILVERLKKKSVEGEPVKRIDGSSNSNDGNDRQQMEERILLEDGLIPVAVTGFDVTTLQGMILTKGCMGRAARASATFPGLFQPVRWINNEEEEGILETIEDRKGEDSIIGKLSLLLSKFKKKHVSDPILIDGGVTDAYGLVGLTALLPDLKKRVVNIVVNGFDRGPLGPSMMPDGLNASEVVSISIENPPQCGPWAMENGPRAVQAAIEGMKAILDEPMFHGEEEGHYILRVAVKKFIPE